MITTEDMHLADGRTLRVYVAEPEATPVVLTVLWHHGTPNVGEPPVPLLPVAAGLGVRWVSFDRPGYGGSTAMPGRTLASVALDGVEVVDRLGVDRFAVMGHSGGASHALATAATLGDRASGAVLAAPLAPRRAFGPLDWFDGMGAAGDAELQAAGRGRAALERHLAATAFDPEQFTSSDHEALGGPWGWLGTVAERALDGGLDGMVDDDLALVDYWACDLERVSCPVLALHGERDRIAPVAHSEWITHRLADATLWRAPNDGHISILNDADRALAWLSRRTSTGS
ncbi:alpha/beta fold hydrolase [Patulibacter sp.]|uniref:alpha/beta fold hydrolase n=1 Tax=Patulibacter sp. TaxID=1912859 RepID=UPI00271C0C7B|nr:alpha/beta hydrolase [Patulibacter sp.]MDO9408986.1 alpha/beta hydrolase [Patulibacter sp.]